MDDYPDISFINNYSITKLENDMMSWFKEKRKELTGEDIVLAAADDRRIILQAGAYFIFQGYMFSDDAGKMGLLKYSRGEFLENLGALKHVYRKAATGASTTIRFSMESVRTTVTGIPKGIRLTAGDGIYFSTDVYSEIKIGGTYVDVSATCTTPGSAGNNYGIGDISAVVDAIPYISKAENITAPENGTDIESDESLRKRIYMAPASYSTAGTLDSYEYYVREFNSTVSDISITSTQPCTVTVRYLLENGEVPGEESINELKEYLEQSSIKPLTDKVEVYAPDLVPYNLNVKYYINQSDKNRAESIQQKVTNAINEYILWQRLKMGRDINPNELIKRALAAGAKRIEIAAPEFATVDSASVASLGTSSITYGGLEDD
ncbi:baseplate J/gp47 family protein [Lacrimispora sp. AGF001]|uniref:baseplate assembly protein n=1 Tax=Lacrimispora sp. AGF001 TaxID=3401631 RepID=UPI003B428C01